jgi:hypothetical protein
VARAELLPFGSKVPVPVAQARKFARKRVAGKLARLDELCDSFCAAFRWSRNSSSSFILPPRNPLNVLPPKSPIRVSNRRQLFIRAHNETLSVAAMCVCNPNRSAVGINRYDTATTPSSLNSRTRCQFLRKTSLGNRIVDKQQRVRPKLLAPPA